MSTNTNLSPHLLWMRTAIMREQSCHLLRQIKEQQWLKYDNEIKCTWLLDVKQSIIGPNLDDTPKNIEKI